MFQEIRAGLGLLVIFVLLTGVGYPLAVTGIGQTLFSHQANGSLVVLNGRIIGSELIGQTFDGDRYFHARPSAAGSGYDASYSAGSNLAPSSLDLNKTVTARVEALKTSGDMGRVPVDLVTASGSGLDPDISVASAKFQMGRIIQARDISLPVLENLISSNTTPRTLGIFGEKRINVLAINLALDTMPPTLSSAPTTDSPVDSQ